MICRVCSSSTVQLCWPADALPKPIQPIQMRETVRSDLPSFAYFMFDILLKKMLLRLPQQLSYTVIGDLINRQEHIIDARRIHRRPLLFGDMRIRIDAE